jgi:plasmid maintenance system antidote protein VapI
MAEYNRRKARRHVSDFTRYVGALLSRRQVEIYPLSRRLDVDPTELLRMINGIATPTKAVIAGLARELDTDVRHLEKLAKEIHLGEQPSE